VRLTSVDPVNCAKQTLFFARGGLFAAVGYAPAHEGFAGIAAAFEPDDVTIGRRAFSTAFKPHNRKVGVTCSIRKRPFGVYDRPSDAPVAGQRWNLLLWTQARRC
jgi:hypothetical protein